MQLLFAAETPDAFWWDTLSNSIANLATGLIVAVLAGWFGHRVSIFSHLDDAEFYWWDTESKICLETAMAVFIAVALSFFTAAGVAPAGTVTTWEDIANRKTLLGTLAGLSMLSAAILTVVALHRSLSFVAMLVARTRSGQRSPAGMEPRLVNRRTVLRAKSKNETGQQIRIARRRLREMKVIAQSRGHGEKL